MPSLTSKRDKGEKRHVGDDLRAGVRAAAQQHGFPAAQAIGALHAVHAFRRRLTLVPSFRPSPIFFASLLRNSAYFGATRG